LLKKRRLDNALFIMRGERQVRALLIFGLLAVSLVLAASCADKSKTASKDFDAADEDEAAQNANVKKNVKPEADAEAAVIETDYGRIVIELYPNLAPNMVARFKQLTKEGFYNGTTFHRVDPGLGIIQGGDPLSKDDNPDNDGSGNSQYPNVAAEFSDIPFERGIVGAARAKSFDSANCQFFITLMRQPAFETDDNRYTVFGRVVDDQSLNNAGVILGAPVVPGTQQPSDKIVIKSITLQPRANFGASNAAH